MPGDTTPRDEALSTTADPSESAEPPKSASDPSRTLLAARYEIIALIGRGGMGNVYKVYDRVLDETVALKTLRGELIGDARAIERFRSEVKLARRVTHRNVARTYETGIEQGIPYLTMELIDGEPLDAIVRRRRRLDPASAIGIARQICDALDAAHGAGVVHRDLKPQNVIVGHDGRVVLTDFGIARATAALARATGIIGTPAYMAPEQVRGAEVGPPADLFALGVILFELTTGELPWSDGTALAIAAARLTDRAPDPRELRRDLPEPLAILTLRCLEPDPRARFASAREVASALLDVEAELAGTTLRSGSTALTTTGSTPRPPVGFEQAPERTIAVLPFRVRGTDESHLAEGLAEELIDELSMTRGVKVRPLSAVLRVAEQGSDARDIGRALGVQVVVEGAVRVEAGTLRGRVALVSVAEGFQLWADRFEGSTSALFDVSARAAAAIAGALLGERFAAPRQAPSSPEVVERYMRARRALRVHWYEGVERAIELFDRALELAPDDPRILSGAAIAAARGTFRPSAAREQRMIEAAELADRAIRAAPDWPEPYVARAIVDLNRGAFAASLGHLRAALARSPDCVDAHELAGQLCVELGPLDRAITHFQTTLELDPGAFKARWELSRALALSGDFEECDALLGWEVDDAAQRKVRDAMRSRVDLWRRQGRWAAELASVEGAESDTLARFVRIRSAIAVTGRFDDADRRYVERALAGAAEGSRYQLALMQFLVEMLAGARAYDDALALAERAVDAGLLDLVWLERCPLLTEVSDDERYRRLHERMKARVAETLRVSAS